MSIIGISGQSQSGKDTVGKIIQLLLNPGWKQDKIVEIITKGYSTYDDTEPSNSWQIKKFAYALKQIVSIITGISVNDLEKEDVKNEPVGIGWDIDVPYFNVKGRELANFWINVLMREYGDIGYEYKVKLANKSGKLNKVNNKLEVLSEPELTTYYPNWIITDTRFPNEAKAIKDRGGIIIRVNRDIDYANYLDACKTNDSRIGYEDLTSEQYPRSLTHFRRSDTPKEFRDKWWSKPSIHPSETALDNYQFDYVIDNNGTINDLVNNVKQILIKEKLL